MKRLTITLLVVVSVAEFASAQSSLSSQQQADLLMLKIEASMADGRAQEALDLINQYRKLGVKVPLPLTLVEGRLAAIEKNFPRSRAALSLYLSDANSRSQPGYATALKLFDEVDKVTTDVVECRKYDNDKPSDVSRALACRRIIQNPISSKDMLADAYEGLHSGLPRGSSEALAAISTAISLKPNNSNFYLLRSVVHSESKNFSAAALDLTQAIALQPNNALYLTFRADAFKKMQEYDKSIRDYTLVLSLKKDDKWALFNRAAAYAAKKDFALALLDYDRLIMLYQSGHDFVNRSDVRAQIGEIDGALSDLNEAIRLEPNQSSFRIARCWFRAVRGIELDKALSDCDEAVRLDPKKASAYESRALVQFKTNNIQKALADYTVADLLSPNSARYVYGRGVSLLKMGNTDEGDAELARARTLDPSVATLLESYGLTL